MSAKVGAAIVTGRGSQLSDGTSLNTRVSVAPAERRVWRTDRPSFGGSAKERRGRGGSATFR